MHRQMWKCLKLIGLLLEEVTKVLRVLNNQPHKQVVEAKHILTTQSLGLQHGYTVNNVEIVPGILLHVTEGVLPMLKVNIKIKSYEHLLIYISYRFFIQSIFICLINQVTELQIIQELKKFKFQLLSPKNCWYV